MVTDRIIYELAVQYSKASTDGERTRIGRDIEVLREGMFNNTRKMLDSHSCATEAKLQEIEANVFRLFNIQKGDAINAFIHFYQKRYDCIYTAPQIDYNRGGILVIINDLTLGGKYKKSHFIPLHSLDGVIKLH